MHELLDGYKKVMKELHLADLELKFGKEFVIWKESGDKLLENVSYMKYDNILFLYLLMKLQ